MKNENKTELGKAIIFNLEESFVFDLHKINKPIAKHYIILCIYSHLNCKDFANLNSFIFGI